MDYRGVLHRDGSVLMSVSLDQLKVSFDTSLSLFPLCGIYIILLMYSRACLMSLFLFFQFYFHKISLDFFLVTDT